MATEQQQQNYYYAIGVVRFDGESMTPAAVQALATQKLALWNAGSAIVSFSEISKAQYDTAVERKQQQCKCGRAKRPVPKADASAYMAMVAVGLFVAAWSLLHLLGTFV